MKNYFLLLTFIPLFLFAQIRFEKGYIINNENEKIECFIKNEEWKNNPQTFEYRLSEDSEKLTTDLQSVKEFGVYNEFEYVKKLVNLEVSPKENINLTTNPQPVFVNKTVFLRTLVKGHASLYEFDDGQVRYFYNINDEELKPLVYKKYIVRGNKVVANNEYKVELWKELKCNSISQSEVKRLKYQKSSLLHLFTKYNECKGNESQTFQSNVKKGDINLIVKPAVSFTSFQIFNNQMRGMLVNKGNIEFEDKMVFRFGLELEYILPINKNKWSVFLEPSFHNYKSKVQLEFLETYEYIGRECEVNYKALELPIGARNYIFLSNDFKIFGEAMLVTSFGIGDNLVNYNNINEGQEDFVYDVKLKSSINAAFGVGLNYNRYSIGIRYYTPKNLSMEYPTSESKYSNILLSAGFKLF